jgi:hypothetical protein
MREKSGASDSESHLNNLNLIIPDEKSHSASGGGEGTARNQLSCERNAENFSIALRQNEMRSMNVNFHGNASSAESADRNERKSIRSAGKLKIFAFQLFVCAVIMISSSLFCPRESPETILQDERNDGSETRKS